MKGFLRSLAAAVAALEGPLLVFPVLVIEIVAATFLFPGGRCGAWQWWLAVAGTVAWAYGRAGNRRSGIAAAGGFLAVLGLLWLLSNATVVEARYDMLRCHVPAVRLLIGGWNPVWGGTPEGIQAEKLTADFLDRNEDAAAMGHVGAWFNAHVSPGLVRAFYRARTGREDFFPESLTWGQAIHEPGTPTTAGWRLAFCTLLLLLLLAGRRGGRFVALCLLAATWTLPTEMLGYRRYVPWTFSAAVFGLPLLHAALARLRVPHRAADLAAAAGALLLLAPVALRMAYRVDDAHAILLLETRTPSPACVVAADLDPGQSIPPGIPEPALGANLLLLAREDPWIARAACPPDGASSADLYARFPANGLAVSPDCDVAAASARHRLFALPDRRARLAATPRFLLSTAFVTLPDTLRLCVPWIWPRTARAPASGGRDGAGERKDGRDGGEAA